MGSTLPHTHVHWVVIAGICAVLYLVFDALRSFAFQLSPVRLRRLESRDGRGKWEQYDTQNFQLVSGALLQIALVVGVAATMMTFDELPIGAAVWRASLMWGIAVMVWKIILAFIPEDAGESIVRALIPISHFFYYLFWPVLFPLRRLFERLETRREEGEGEEEEVTDEEVQAYIDVGTEEGILEGSEGRLVQQIVDFGNRLAHEIMTPRIDVVSFDARRPFAELAALFSESKYARIPIYTESIDQVTGIVHIKDVLDALLKGGEVDVTTMARAPYVVSETKSVSELLREFQSEHLQAAIVVDEYGGTAGLITIEDIVEEIVGDIADEHEDEEATIVELGQRVYLVSGLLRVEELEEMLETELTGDDYETVAGLIFTTLGRVPKVGTVVTKNGYRFEVDRADRRRIYRVRVSPDPDWKSEDHEEE